MRALALRGPDGGPALSWTTQLQLPDRHYPGLRAQPLWADLPAAAMLEADFVALAAEFAAVLAAVGGVDAFGRRRADAWIPNPRDGWGMLALEPHCTTAAPATCALVRLLRGEVEEAGPGGAVGSGLAGVGYYLLRPGATLRAHAGPTNERLTCHLTLRGGEGAGFLVGVEAVSWTDGEAFCFDDSFVHEAFHAGDANRFVLLVDVPHPDLPEEDAAGFQAMKS